MERLQCKTALMYNHILKLIKEIQQLKQENEKLKEEKQGLIKDWEEKKNLGYEIACKNEKLKAENEKLKRLISKQKNAKIQLSKLKDKQFKEFCDMKQVLKEIQETARKSILQGKMTSSGWLYQKISEVIDE